MKIEPAPGKLKVGFMLTHASLQYDKIHAVLTSEDHLIGIVEDSKNMIVVINRHDKEPFTLKDDINAIKKYAIEHYNLQSGNQLTEIPYHQNDNTHYFLFAKPAQTKH